MQLAVVPTSITSNVPVKGSFKIKASGKAFKLLSSGLYAEKELAVVRELSTNAWDSHRKAKCPNKPFEVHLPSNAEPWFSIRDFGTGLDDVEIDEVYTTYFESTKAETNDEAGFMGLGSKSPFSYTDSFTVVAIKNGVRRIYTMALDAGGEPVPRLMLTADTDEPNGVEVKIPVNMYHFKNFITAAERVYRTFDVKPIVVGVEDFVIMKVIAPQEYIFRNELYGIRANKNIQGPIAVQGPVGYPLSFRMADIPDENVFNFMDVFFPIGKLDPAASREHLSYDETTKANIAHQVRMILTRIKNDITDYIDNAPTLFDAYMHIDKFAEIISLRHAGIKSIEYKGKTITQGYHEFKNREAEGFRFIHAVRKERRRSVTYEVTSVGGIGAPKTSLPITNELYFANDIGKQGLSKFKSYIKEHRVKQAHLISFSDRYLDLPKHELFQCCEWVAKEIGGLIIIPLSTLPKPVVVKKPKVLDRQFSYVNLNSFTTYKFEKFKIQDSNIAPGPRYYMTSKAWEEYQHAFKLAAKTLMQHQKLTNVYILNQIDYNIVMKSGNTNWVPFSDYVISLFSKSEIKKIQDYRIWSARQEVLAGIFGASSSPEKSEFLKAIGIDLSFHVKPATSDYQRELLTAVGPSLRLFDVDTYNELFKDEPLDIDFTPYHTFRANIDRYPLLKYITWRSMIGNTNEYELLDYIRLIEDTK